MSEKGTENFIVGGGVLQRNSDGSFTEVESFATNIERDSNDAKNCRTQVQQEPFKEIIDFAKTHLYEYMKISSQQYPHWGNEDKGVMIETFELTDNITYKIPRIFIKNNYLKMHGKSMNRRVAGRKGVRKKEYQIST